MFRRKPETTTTASSARPTVELTKPGGKGRPTPTRKEAEAARKARAKVPTSRRERTEAQRAVRGESSAKIREAMRTGEERYLPARDKGPVRRFVRDYVDSRFTIIELVLPLLVVSMVLQYSVPGALAFANLFMLLILLAVAANMVLLRMGLRRQLKQRFPDKDYRGTTMYAISRAMQLRFLRMPKAQVKIGQELPETYR